MNVEFQFGEKVEVRFAAKSDLYGAWGYTFTPLLSASATAIVLCEREYSIGPVKDILFA